MKLTIVFMTGRRDPKLEWMLDSLASQTRDGDEISLIVVDVHARELVDLLPDAHDHLAGCPGLQRVILVPPKPNAWQGAHRVTSRDWWATSNSRNTALALCTDDYVAFLDDRCHLGSKWLETVRLGHVHRNSVIVGSYDKIEGADRHLSSDHRRGLFPEGKINCGGGWLYGCTFALPLSWALEVNGFEEGCDGLTGEDYIFGLMLGNAGRRIDFVPDLFVLQDRTPGNETCKGLYASRDKGVSPNDKSHAALARFGTRARTEFTPDLALLRASIARGEPFPVPDPTAEPRDWYDGQPIREMVLP